VGPHAGEERLLLVRAGERLELLDQGAVGFFGTLGLVRTGVVDQGKDINHHLLVGDRQRQVAFAHRLLDGAHRAEFKVVVGCRTALQSVTGFACRHNSQDGGGARGVHLETHADQLSDELFTRPAEPSVGDARPGGRLCYFPAERRFQHQDVV
jgi:hypothetical protein